MRAGIERGSLLAGDAGLLHDDIARAVLGDDAFDLRDHVLWLDGEVGGVSSELLVLRARHRDPFHAVGPGALKEELGVVRGDPLVRLDEGVQSLVDLAEYRLVPRSA